MARKIDQHLKEMPRMKGLKGLKRGRFPKGSKFPKWVDIVTARDIHCGELSGGKGHKQHCLLGLAAVNFSGLERGVDLDSFRFVESPANLFVVKELEKSISAFTGGLYTEVTGFNDDVMDDENKYWIARVWNATMARIGYFEGNPEAEEEG